MNWEQFRKNDAFMDGLITLLGKFMDELITLLGKFVGGLITPWGGIHGWAKYLGGGGI